MNKWTPKWTTPDLDEALPTQKPMEKNRKRRRKCYKCGKWEYDMSKLVHGGYSRGPMYSEAHFRHKPGMCQQGDTANAADAFPQGQQGVDSAT